jgi:hypothetical protein
MNKQKIPEDYKFTHFRLPSWAAMDGQGVLAEAKPDSRGGATVAYVTRDDKTYAAIAFCNPKDNFNYAYGRAKAAGRLTQLLTFPEKADNDKFHVSKDSDGIAFLVRLRSYMLDGLGYIHRGKKVKQAPGV